MKTTPATLPLPQTLKLYPEIIFHARRQRHSLNAYRLWFLCKVLDLAGSGCLPRVQLLHTLTTDLGIDPQALRRWLKAARTLGLLHADGAMLYLASWQDGAAVAGCAHLMRGVTLPLASFLTPGWLAWCWAGILARYDGPIARETLTALWGVPARTQYDYERQTGVVITQNYANFGKVADSPMLAIAQYGQPGHYTRHGELRRRLPDTRRVSGVMRTAKGRCGKINQALLIKEGSAISTTPIDLASHPLACTKHTHRLTLQGRSVCRRYAFTPVQVKKALRALRKPDLDWRARPPYIYEKRRRVRGVLVFDAIVIDPLD